MDDLQIYNVDPETNKVTFVVKPRKVSGISKLIQIVLLSLLNNPGKDVLDPDKGGGLEELVGFNINPKDSTVIFAEVSRRIKKSEREILEDQIGSSDTPTEKLRELQLVDITEGNIDQINVRVRIINQAGQTSDVTV
jgi:phage baseplate assembly protein W